MAKIMLVEDDNNLREIYGARLMAEGYEIISAHDGEEALAMAVKEKPDLIISDIMMPNISGFDMLDILRATPETQNTRVIVMTALGQAEDKARADKLGADMYLVKSQVTLEDVAKSVHEVLEGKVKKSFNAGTEPIAPFPAASDNPVVTPIPEPPKAADGDGDEPAVAPADPPADDAPSAAPADDSPADDAAPEEPAVEDATPEPSSDEPVMPVSETETSTETVAEAPAEAPAELPDSEVSDEPAAPDTTATASDEAAEAAAKIEAFVNQANAGEPAVLPPIDAPSNNDVVDVPVVEAAAEEAPAGSDGDVATPPEETSEEANNETEEPEAAAEASTPKPDLEALLAQEAEHETPVAPQAGTVIGATETPEPIKPEAEAAPPEEPNAEELPAEQPSETETEPNAEDDAEKTEESAEPKEESAEGDKDSAKPKAGPDTTPTIPLTKHDDPGRVSI